jgi:DDE family transposase
MGLDGQDVREIFEAALPEEGLAEIIKATGFEERSRKRDAIQLVRAMIVAAATGYGGRQADVMRVYFENGAERVVRGGFYSWFGQALETTMAQVARRMLDFVNRQPLDLPGLLGRDVRDWHIVDSTTVRLDDALTHVFPGAGDYAAAKVHKRFSVGLGTLVDYSISPARDHDAPHLVIDESWRGLGLLVDLGYASLKLLSDCQAFGVHFVIRLKDNWKPRVQTVGRGEVKGTFLPGTDLDVLLDAEAIVLNGTAIDVDVELGRGAQTVRCRLVGVPVTDGAYRFYLTSLPPKTGPCQVADLYRVRWEIESDNKLDKSCNHLEGIQARTKASVCALIHASLVSSMLACLLVHRARLKDAPPPAPDAERTKAPLHPQTLARAMGSAALMIAAAFEESGPRAQTAWQRIADHLSHLGSDPNWRRSPSILDQMRGWRISAGRPRSQALRA